MGRLGSPVPRPQARTQRLGGGHGNNACSARGRTECRKLLVGITQLGTTAFSRRGRSAPAPPRCARPRAVPPGGRRGSAPRCRPTCRTCPPPSASRRARWRRGPPAGAGPGPRRAPPRRGRWRRRRGAGRGGKLVIRPDPQVREPLLDARPLALEQLACAFVVHYWEVFPPPRRRSGRRPARPCRRRCRQASCPAADAPGLDRVEHERVGRLELVEVRTDLARRVGGGERVAVVAALAEDHAAVLLGGGELDAAVAHVAVRVVGGQDDGRDRDPQRDVEDREEHRAPCGVRCCSGRRAAAAARGEAHRGTR